MLKALNIVIAFLISTFSFFNVKELPQNEKRNEEEKEQIIVEKVDIEDTHSEEIKPQKIVARNSSINNETGTSWWSYPDDIKECSRSGDDLLVLINKKYKLPSTYIPSGLVKVGEDVIRRGSNYYLRSILINDLRAMVADAKASGIDLSAVSAYRSYSTQQSTYKYWVGYNDGCVDCADRISARAGHSQHQLGTTLDFSSSEIGDGLGGQFTNTKASNWLKENAHKYGFVIGYPQGYESVTGYSFESWHYRYIGRENALEMKNSGMILEQYLRGKN